MEHVENVYDSLKHYFGVLEQSGMYPKYETMGLLLYCFITDQVFDGSLSEYLDDAGLAAFNKVLRCLYRKGCLFNNPETVRLSTPRDTSFSSILRSTEDLLQRSTEHEEPRRIE